MKILHHYFKKIRLRKIHLHLRLSQMMQWIMMKTLDHWFAQRMTQE
jgi:hypothetical protein